MKEKKKKLKKIITNISKYKKKIDDNMVLNNSILDSFNMILLIAKIEEEFSIKLNEKDLHYKNFTSINKIVKMINKKC